MEDKIGNAPAGTGCHLGGPTRIESSGHEPGVFLAKDVEMISPPKIDIRRSHNEPDLFQQAGKFAPFGHRKGRTIVHQDLNTYVVGPGIMMLFHPLGNLVERAPTDDFIDEAI